MKFGKPVSGDGVGVLDDIGCAPFVRLPRF
jgi:hypothetical protein